MARYVRATKFEAEFEGEPVSCLLSQLSLEDFIELDAADVEGDDDAQLRESVKIISRIAPKYVSEWLGPKDADGNMVPLDEVFRSAYFIELAIKIGVKLIEASRPPKKPSEPSGS